MALKGNKLVVVIDDELPFFKMIDRFNPLTGPEGSNVSYHH